MPASSEAWRFQRGFCEKERELERLRRNSPSAARKLGTEARWSGLVDMLTRREEELVDGDESAWC